MVSVGRKGGGVVKLAAGDYYLRTCGFQLMARWILLGSGMDNTILHYGYCNNSWFETGSHLFFYNGVVSRFSNPKSYLTSDVRKDITSDFKI